MKKKYFILCVVVLLIPCIYKELVYRNLSKCPVGPKFRTKNGSHINIRTIFKQP